MKLNLLPTYVTKGKATRTAVIVSIIVFLASVAAAIGMSWAASELLAQNKAAEELMRPKAQATVDTYAYAASITQDPTVTQVLRNTALAQAMINHNAKYPNFYNKFTRYIPPFFRLTSIQAVPNDAETATVTMNGALRSYQQYADLMLLLMRYPGSVSVGRAGFQSTDPVVPPVSPANPTGRPMRPGETPLPQDPLERLQFLQGQNYNDPGFTGTGNFGTEGNATRLAAPGYSVVTVTVIVRENLQVPNITGTLAASGAPAAAPGAGGGMPGMGGPGMPGMAGAPPGMPGAPPGMPPGMGAGMPQR